MEFYLNFDKSHISAKVFNFLDLNIKEEEAKMNMARLKKGLKLQYKEANAFIETLLRALTLEDGEEDIPFVTKKSEFEDESFHSTLNGGTNTNNKGTSPTDPGEGSSKLKDDLNMVSPRHAVHE